MHAVSPVVPFPAPCFPAGRHAHSPRRITRGNLCTTDEDNGLDDSCAARCRARRRGYEKTPRQCARNQSSTRSRRSSSADQPESTSHTLNIPQDRPPLLLALSSLVKPSLSHRSLSTKTTRPEENSLDSSTATSTHGDVGGVTSLPRGSSNVLATSRLASALCVTRYTYGSPCATKDISRRGDECESASSNARYTPTHTPPLTQLSFIPAAGMRKEWRGGEVRQECQQHGHITGQNSHVKCTPPTTGVLAGNTDQDTLPYVHEYHTSSRHQSMNEYVQSNNYTNNSSRNNNNDDAYSVPDGAMETNYGPQSPSVANKGEGREAPRRPPVEINFFWCCGARTCFAMYILVTVLLLLITPVLTIIMLNVQGDCSDVMQSTQRRRLSTTAGAMCDADNTTCRRSPRTMRWAKHTQTETPSILSTLTNMSVRPRIAHMLGAKTRVHHRNNSEETQTVMTHVKEASPRRAPILQGMANAGVAPASDQTGHDVGRAAHFSVPAFAPLLANLSLSADTGTLLQRYDEVLREVVRLGDASLLAITEQRPDLRQDAGGSAGDFNLHSASSHIFNAPSSSLAGRQQLLALPDVTVFSNVPMLLAQAYQECYLIPNCWHGGGRVAVQLTSTLVSRIVLTVLRAVLIARPGGDAEVQNESELAENGSMSNLAELLSVLVHALCGSPKSSDVVEHEASAACASLARVLYDGGADERSEDSIARDGSASVRETRSHNNAVAASLARRIRGSIDTLSREDIYGGTSLAPDFDAFHFAIGDAWKEQILRTGSNALSMLQRTAQNTTHNAGLSGEPSGLHSPDFGSAHNAFATPKFEAQTTNASWYDDDLANALRSVRTAAAKDLSENSAICSYEFSVFKDMRVAFAVLCVLGLALHMLLIMLVRYRVYQSPTSFRVVLCSIGVMFGVFLAMQSITLYMARLLTDTGLTVVRVETVTALQRYNATFHAIDALSSARRSATPVSTMNLWLTSPMSKSSSVRPANTAATRAPSSSDANEPMMRSEQRSRATNAANAYAVAERPSRGNEHDEDTKCGTECTIAGRAKTVYDIMRAYNITHERLRNAHMALTQDVLACESYALGMAMGATQIAMTDLMRAYSPKAGVKAVDVAKELNQSDSGESWSHGSDTSALEQYCRIVDGLIKMHRNHSTRFPRCAVTSHAGHVWNATSPSCCVPAMRDCVSGLGFLGASERKDAQTSRTNVDSAQTHQSAQTTRLTETRSMLQQSKHKVSANELRLSVAYEDTSRLKFEPDAVLLWTTILGSIAYALLICTLWHLLMGDSIFYDLL